MFYHNFKYTCKVLFHNKMLLFWTFFFPIILGTFFQMAFSDIEKSETLDIMDIAVVEEQDSHDHRILNQALKVLGDSSNQEQLFHISYVSEQDAKDLLQEDKIIGYLLLQDEPKVVVATSGIYQTVFKYVIQELIQQEDMIQNMIEKEPTQKVEINQMEKQSAWYQEIYEKVLSLWNENQVNIQDNSSRHLSYTMIEFYTLIAMACLYGGTIGMYAINQNLPNMSHNGKRVAVSPTSKFQFIFSSALASLVIQLIGLILLFLYTIFVLKVDYGNHLFLVILLAFVGSFTGLSFGIFIASTFKTNENMKTGILISLTMLGCVLSGMTGITLKYIIDKNIPLVNRLNPANMITDGLYSLYYYETLDRFYVNLISLLIFAFVMIFISIFCLRRQSYDNI